MQKLINHPDDFVDEALDGFLLANARTVRRRRRRAARDRAGGARRPAERGDRDRRRLRPPPAVHGYVGPGFADGCAVGNMFASPSTDQMLAVTQAVDAGAACCTSTATTAATR